VVIDVVPAQESDVAAKARNDKRGWLAERGYRVLAVDASMIETDLPRVLDGLAASIAGRP
jgi:tRNA/rRNA methyltransferase